MPIEISNYRCLRGGYLSNDALTNETKRSRNHSPSLLINP